MDLRPVNTAIAIAVSALIAFGLWNMGGGLKNFVAIGSFVFLAGTLIPAIGIDFVYARRATNIRVVAVTFFVVGLVGNILFSVGATSSTAYVLVSAITFLAFVYIANSIHGTRQ